MHRVRLTIGLALLLLGCDPVVSSTFRLTPSPVAAADSVTARAGAARADMLAAVERLALQFGLKPEPPWPGRCAQAWRLSSYTRPYADGPRKALGDLFICVAPSTVGPLEVRVSETITTEWSPKGDSLRRALADTLARFGSVSSP